MPVEHCSCGRTADNRCIRCNRPFCDKYFQHPDGMCEPCSAAYYIAQIKQEKKEQERTREIQEKLKDPEFVKGWGHTYSVEEVMNK